MIWCRPATALEDRSVLSHTLNVCTLHVWWHRANCNCLVKVKGCYALNSIGQCASCYPGPDRDAGYAMNVYLCLCSSVNDHIFRATRLIFSRFFVHVSCSRGLVLLWWHSDTLRISGLWMTSYLHVRWGCLTSPLGWGSEAHMQPWACHILIPVAGSGCSGLLLAVRAYWAAVGALSIYDMMFAHNVLAYIATRKWRVLKVTLQVATPEAESVLSMTSLCWCCYLWVCIVWPTALPFCQ